MGGGGRVKSINVNSWDEFKAIVEKKQLLIQYEENSRGYELFSPEAGVFLWEITILKGSVDCSDFESNFKSKANAPVEVKGGIGKPNRVAPSAQPIGTVESWRGYYKESPDGEESFVFDLGFNQDVYLRGGTLFSPDAVHGDTISASIVLKDSPETVLVPDVLDNVVMLKETLISFLSQESMLIPTSAMLRATYTKGSDKGERHVSAMLDYFR